mmetsp:Transcript_439/g.1702  ORF Transcript_439/g.1702 Transcript_439/m.1702 type:complete len:206 (-) Transcript_439:1627-2244(-)
MATLTARLLAFPKSNPFNFNLLVATAKTSAADVVTQTAVERRSLEDLDWRRNASFAVFGLLYLGGFQYWLQVTMFRRWFRGIDKFTELSFFDKLRDGPGLVTAAKQIGFDCFVHLPFMYYPTFYVVKQAVQGDDGARPDLWATHGLSKYVTNFVPDQTAMLSVWFPADIVIFSVPLWLRLPTRHVVSFGWTAYLSFLRGGNDNKS